MSEYSFGSWSKTKFAPVWTTIHKIRDIFVQQTSANHALHSATFDKSLSLKLQAAQSQPNAPPQKYCLLNLKNVLYNYVLSVFQQILTDLAYTFNFAYQTFCQYEIEKFTTRKTLLVRRCYHAESTLFTSLTLALQRLRSTW